MSTCRACKKPLKDSLSQGTGELLLKSCPRCSRKAGEHIYYPEDKFGHRKPRVGGEYIESWCTACRGHRAPPPPTKRCSDFPRK